MLHKGTVPLETSRLILRAFRASDTSAMFHNWASDEKVTEFLRWPAHKSVETTEKVLKNWTEAYAKPDFYQWAIVLKENEDGPIGTISVVGQNDRLKMVHIGYALGRPWWNRGIMSEAFSKIIAFFFEEVKVNRIESQHDPNNPASGRVMVKCGLQYEGTLRQADFSNQGIVDAAMYSLLAQEYFRTQTEPIEL